MDFDELDRQLRESIEDRQLDNDERDALRNLGNLLDGGRLRFLRNRAFAIGRERVAAEPADAIDVMRWLEQVVRTLDRTPTSGPEGTRVHFSPGDDCLRELLALCRQCRQHLDICVYTIADDRLSDAILACHERGVAVRLISDNDKKYDDGSDVRALRDAGIPVRVDDQPHHMHHKFALFDRRVIANGSFNWTRSASRYNEENLVVSDDARLVDAFTRRFDDLWSRFART